MRRSCIFYKVFIVNQFVLICFVSALNTSVFIARPYCSLVLSCSTRLMIKFDPVTDGQIRRLPPLQVLTRAHTHAHFIVQINKHIPPEYVSTDTH